MTRSVISLPVSAEDLRIARLAAAAIALLTLLGAVLGMLWGLIPPLFFEEAFLPNVNVYKFVLRMTFVSWPIAVLWLVTHRLCGHFMEIILTMYKKPLNLMAKFVYDYFRKD